MERELAHDAIDGTAAGLVANSSLYHEGHDDLEAHEQTTGGAVNVSHTNEALAKLHELGAHELEHLNGDLAQHLKGTYALLHEWGNPEPICLAGLFHAVYGTAVFPAQLLSLGRRADVAAIVGGEAEALAYLYGACDRKYTYSQIVAAKEPVYRDRFTQKTFTLGRSVLTSFCELTLANELQIVSESSEHRERFRAFYVGLFTKFNGLVSRQAFEAYLAAFETTNDPVVR